MSLEKTKKPKWDGRSRVSNNVYRKRYNEIFNKKGNVVNTEESFVSKEYSVIDPNNEDYE
jgi:hypothetical protein